MEGKKGGSTRLAGVEEAGRGGGSWRCGWVARRGGGGPAEVGPMRGEGGWRQRHSVMQGRGRGDARWGLVAVRGEN
jgi:hypothetical protein